MLLLADRNAVSAAANAAAPVAQQFAERLATMSYDPAIALRAVQGITQDSGTISPGDERTAEQAAMAVDLLYTASRPIRRMRRKFAPPSTACSSN